MIDAQARGHVFPVPPGLQPQPRGGGQPLPPAVQRKMEQAFGASLADVRVHVRPEAASLGAVAFTMGSHIYFAPGHYDPHSAHGQRLLGHEVTHVVQQRTGRVRNPLGSGVAVVQDPGLEAEAERMGLYWTRQPMPAAAPVQPKAQVRPVGNGPLAPHVQRAVQMKPAAPPPVRPVAAHVLAAPPPPRPVPQPVQPPAAPVVQRFRVLEGDKIYDRMPASRPWFGYPYAVVRDAEFPAQAIRRRVGGVNEFLKDRGGNRANIRYHSKEGLSLRVSDDNNMAIENTDLTGRQPKSFYATQEVVNASNTALAQVRSKFRLKTGGWTIRILTGWSGTTILKHVTPVYYPDTARPTRKVNPDRAPQNCNLIANEVTGIFNVVSRGGLAALDAASRIADVANTGVNDDALARGYLRGLRRGWSRDSSVRANASARPDVGDAFMIGTLGTPTPLGGGRSRVRDQESGQDRDLSWSYHFGGVVARSGTDRVTLENYARGDDRQGNPDPRWYFQMYGEGRGQSFHEFFKAKQDYANPITVTVRNPRNTPLPPLPNLGPVSPSPIGIL